MKTLKERIVRNWVYIVGAVSLTYFIAMSQFYIVSYYVPDFYGYMAMIIKAEKPLPVDAFSSLFVTISPLAYAFPFVLTIMSLVFLTLSLFLFNYVFYKLKKTDLFDYIVFLVASFSSGCWYYFYGKIYYDFPYTALSFSLALLALYYLLDAKREKAYDFVWYSFPLALGFCLSWKAYNIFPVAGLCLLILINKHYFKEFLFKNWLINYLKIGGLFFMGYFIGNFSFLYAPLQSAQGVRGYGASHNLLDHLFLNTRTVWDHVNMSSFDMAVFSVLPLFLILFILPLFVRNKLFLAVSIFMSVCYGVFISYFSPGYVWHGFVFGLFVLTFLLFILIESESIKGKRRLLFRSIVVIAISLQFLNNFLNYMPKQIAWFNTTQEAISLFENNAAKINLDLLNLTKKIKGSFHIDVAIKNEAFIRKIDMETDKKTLRRNALAMADYEGWELLTTKNRRYKKENFQTQIVVEPYSFYSIPSFESKIRKRKDVTIIDYGEYRIAYFKVR